MLCYDGHVLGSNSTEEVVMSKEALNEIVERALDDLTFREELSMNPDAVLARYDLTESERQALMASDPLKLADVGVEPRLTKRVTAPGASCCGETVVK
jgi:hypothetical protein